MYELTCPHAEFPTSGMMSGLSGLSGLQACIQEEVFGIPQQFRRGPPAAAFNGRPGHTGTGELLEKIAFELMDENG